MRDLAHIDGGYHNDHCNPREREQQAEIHGALLEAESDEAVTCTAMQLVKLAVYRQFQLNPAEGRQSSRRQLGRGIYSMSAAKADWLQSSCLRATCT